MVSGVYGRLGVAGSRDTSLKVDWRKFFLDEDVLIPSREENLLLIINF